MPIPKPEAKETQNDYVGRCMHEIASEYDTNEQAVAICISTYEKETAMSAYTKNRIAAQMYLAKVDAAERGIFLGANEGGASYPWDECIADQTARYGDENVAARVCGYIKSEYGS